MLIFWLPGFQKKVNSQPCYIIHAIKLDFFFNIVCGLFSMVCMGPGKKQLLGLEFCSAQGVRQS